MFGYLVDTKLCRFEKSYLKRSSGRLILIRQKGNKAKGQVSERVLKIRYFHLTSWCGYFVERHSFGRVSGGSPETLAETVRFHKISTPGNYVRLRYFYSG